jgi:uncharacterized membrane protein YfcA
MNASHAALLLGAGLAAGTVNAVAGGGSLVTYPALLVAGLPPKPANVTNSVAVSPGYLASVYGSRHELPTKRDALAILPTAVLGTVVGCVLLIATPAGAFELIVPFLVISSALVLALQERLRRVVGHPRHTSRRRRLVGLHATVGLGAVYGGYFGAALGVMLVAGLGLVLDEALTRVNARKNLVSATTGVVTVLVFAAVAQVDWVAVAVLAPATLTGGYLGARLARRLPAPVLRAVIVTLGLAVGVYLLVKALAGH